MRSHLILLAALGASLAVAPEVHACWAAEEPSSVAERCPIIVTGTIGRITVTNSGRDRDDDVAHLWISAIHKNLLEDVPLKVGGELQVKMTSINNRIRISTDLRYSEGTCAVWLIWLSEDGSLRLDVRPEQRQPADCDVKALLSRRALAVTKRRGGVSGEQYSKREWLARLGARDGKDPKEGEQKLSAKELPEP